MENRKVFMIPQMFNPFSTNIDIVIVFIFKQKIQNKMYDCKPIQGERTRKGASEREREREDWKRKPEKAREGV